MKKLIQKKCSQPNCNGVIKALNHLWLKEQRIKAKITLREFARNCGYSAAFISDIELGRRNANDKVINYYLTLQKK